MILSLRPCSIIIDGSLEGKSELMHSAFHDHATIFGHFGGDLVSGPIQILYDSIDENGPDSPTSKK